MKHTTNESLEQLSALADGHLQGEELAHALDAAGHREELRVAWHTYHLVGEVLRTGAHAPCADSGAFVARLQRRLAAEAVVRPAVVPAAPAVLAGHVRAEAANAPVLRWKLAAGVASVAAAAAIGWAWVGALPAARGGAQMAQQTVPPAQPSTEQAVGGVPVLAASPSPVPLASTRVAVGAAGAPQVMLRDPRLDELLEAHQQAIGASQMPSGFLRNATFEGAAR